MCKKLPEAKMAGKRNDARKAAVSSGAGYLGYLFVVALVLSAVCLLRSTATQWKVPESPKLDRENGTDFGILGVPWYISNVVVPLVVRGHCRTKKGLQAEWTRKDLLQSLGSFVALYETRPIANNAHGMLFDHSFGLWFIASWLKPEIIIESGAFKGHSTWILRQARSSVPIISISPRHPQKYLNKGEAYVDSNCKYFSGADFLDFGSIDWNAVLQEYKIQDRGKVLVFFDDHQNELRRVKEALAAGFQHLVFEDNYDTGTGDHYSLRQICDQVHIRGGGHSCQPDGDESRVRSSRRLAWEKAVGIEELCGKRNAWWGVKGHVKDNFNHISSPISKDEHRGNADYLESVLDVFWELPPVAAPSLTKQTRYDPARTTSPLISDGDMLSFHKHRLNVLNTSVFNGYTQMAYVKVST